MVASVARLSSRRSISLSCATRMARRAPSSNCSGGMPPCLQARELAEAEFEDARHAGGAAAAFDLPVQRGEVAARPEAVLEVLGFVVRARQQRALAENDGPGQQRGEQQQAHDAPARSGSPAAPVGLSRVHCPSLTFVLAFGSMKSGSGRGRNVFASTQATRTVAFGEQHVVRAQIFCAKRIDALPSGTGTQVMRSSSSSRAGLR